MNNVDDLYSETIDFGALACLTEALLARDFGLSISLPEGRLCPPVPNRYHYVNWLQNVMLAYNKRDEEVWGLDIGTGASAIYPLLACTKEARWSMIGTDIDELSLQYARQNVTLNRLDERIKIVQTSADRPLLEELRGDGKPTRFAFTMCNPPFYQDEEEISQLAQLKEFDPYSVCTGAKTEMITEGGEVHFVRRMISESLELRTRCRWFTSLLGKFSSVKEVIEKLRSEKIENYALTEIIQGQTRRWVIAWSFGDIRLPDVSGACCTTLSIVQN
ncbi:S-adenosyl-L-methionine dependent methyltransferase [Clavulina sp. PMI_390]|nr:S-adenosyl-L-methionine dependent methyltransferase [Clavulina sp. PMI_390]